MENRHTPWEACVSCVISSNPFVPFPLSLPLLVYSVSPLHFQFLSFISFSPLCSCFSVSRFPLMSPSTTPHLLCPYIRSVATSHLLLSTSSLAMLTVDPSPASPSHIDFLKIEFSLNRVSHLDLCSLH